MVHNETMLVHDAAEGLPCHAFSQAEGSGQSFMQTVQGTLQHCGGRHCVYLSESNPVIA